MEEARSREERSGQRWGSWIRTCCSGAREVHGEVVPGTVQASAWKVWEKEMPGRWVAGHRAVCVGGDITSGGAVAGELREVIIVGLMRRVLLMIKQ